MLYLSAFGLMIILSFCNFDFIKKYFFFLKTTTGRGWFDIFCSFMFVVTVNKSIWGWVMLGVLMVCGVFFVVIGYKFSGKSDPAGADYDSGSLANKAGTAALMSKFN